MQAVICVTCKGMGCEACNGAGYLAKRSFSTYGNVSARLAAWAAKVPHAQELGNEGPDGYWLYLEDGWKNPDLEKSFYHEYTVALLKQAVTWTPPVANTVEVPDADKVRRCFHLAIQYAKNNNLNRGEAAAYFLGSLEGWELLDTEDVREYFQIPIE